MYSDRHFDRSVIMLCVRWYLAYNLSLRDLEEMLAERGLSVDHSTVHRWVVRFAPHSNAVTCTPSSSGALQEQERPRWHVCSRALRGRISCR